MAWETRECPVGSTDLDSCDAPGCRALARFRFATKNTTTGEHRFALRCDDHAGDLRTAIVRPPPAPRQQSIDPTAAALEPKAPEKPKRPPKTWPIPHGAMPSVCSSCSDSIHWIVTEAGRRMPINAFGELAGASHFINCKNADQHRKSR